MIQKNEIFLRLKKILKEAEQSRTMIYQFPELTMQSVLGSELAIGSLELLFLVCAMEDEFHIKIPERILPTFVTVQDVCNYIEKTASC